MKQSWFDPRMKGFYTRTELLDAQSILRGRVSPLGMEIISLENGFRRVLAQPMVSKISVPHFDRSAMDGYALRGEDTFGADSLNPRELKIIGESMPGHPCSINLDKDQAVRIMTGAKMPAGANAVIPAEATKEIGEGDNSNFGVVQVFQPIPPGKNIGKIGEDIQADSLILNQGRVLRPQDIGLLSSIGINEIPVVRSPKVRILITGNEILPAGSLPIGEKISDSNSLTLRGLIQRDGGQPLFNQILPDDPAILEEALLNHQANMVLISGGSSVGKEDHAPAILKKLGELTVHGIAMRPASPAGFGFLPGGVPVFLIPGNPVSCLCAYDLLVCQTLRKMAGLPEEMPYSQAKLFAGRNLTSGIGRVDYVRVRVNSNGLVEPVSGSGASNLSSTTRADGFVLIAQDSEGYAEGERVQVYFYDENPVDYEARTIFKSNS